jgi:hypothetical protein
MPSDRVSRCPTYFDKEGGVARQTHTREVFRLPDLLTVAPGPDYIISNRNFQDCDFHGPAVFAVISGVNLSGPHINGDLEAVLWEIPPSRTQIIGAFGLRNCDILGCSFTNIGFAGAPEMVRDFRAAAGGT